MKKSQYIDIINSQQVINQIAVGKLVGKGIKDIDLKPREFEDVLSTAKRRGFRMANIELIII